MTQHIDLLAHIAASLNHTRTRVAVAESCTGGMIAAQMTDLAGSSSWFEGGVVSYSNALKEQLLGVSLHTLNTHGAVSQSCAEQMADGITRLTGADYGIATTGIAGPGGGSIAKPVGLVWFAWQGPKGLYSEQHVFAGTRQQVRQQAVKTALEGLLKSIKNNYL